MVCFARCADFVMRLASLAVSLEALAVTTGTTKSLGKLLVVLLSQGLDGPSIGVAVNDVRAVLARVGWRT